MTLHLANMFRGSGIEFSGHVVIGSDGKFTTLYGDLQRGPGGGQVVDAGDRSPTTVPAVERRIVTRETLGPQVTGPEAVIEIADRIAGTETGMLMLDSRTRPIAFYPVDANKLISLRTLKRLDPLYRALATANAAQVILIDSGEVKASPNAVSNLMTWLGMLDIPMHDWIAGPPGRRVSAVSEGWMPSTQSTFFQGGERIKRAAVSFRHLGKDNTHLNPEDLQQKERGYIQFGKDRSKFNITLLEGADPSTFLHELGHFYLEMLQAEAAKSALQAADQKPSPAPTTLTPGPAGSLHDDLEIIRQWLGAEEGRPLTRDQHEQWAREFEAYLMEGKAPSVDLIGTFARFRAWLTAVYRNLKNLNVELTDEVRGVMDRMLASDDEIARARQVIGATELFHDEASSGMTSAEFAAYQKATTRSAESGRQDLLQQVLEEQRQMSARVTSACTSGIWESGHGFRSLFELNRLILTRRPV